jgi:putative methyltransferase (TIGR04325 family)
MKRITLFTSLFTVINLLIPTSSFAAGFINVKSKLSRSISVQGRSYNSYEEALMKCKGSSYEDSEIVKVVVRKNAIFTKQNNLNKIIELNSLRAILGVALASEKETLRVIDFGGGGGHSYTIARSVLDPKKDLLWNVVETPAMVKEAKCLETAELNFFDDVESAAKNLKSVDLVLTSGTLHCCNDPNTFLQSLIAVKSKYLFITRTSFNEGSETLFSVQKSLLSANGPGLLPSEFSEKEVLYPNVFVPINQIEDLLQSEFNVRFKILEDKNVYKVGKKAIHMYGYFCERKA